MTAEGSVLVGWDITDGEKDLSILIVGKKLPNRSVEIINMFQGAEAEELYKKLITPQKIQKSTFAEKEDPNE